MTLAKSDKIYIDNLLDKKLDDQILKFEKIITRFKDNFYTKIDPILKEVVASREDRLLGAEQHIRNQNRIEDLEKLHPNGRHLATV